MFRALPHQDREVRLSVVPMLDLHQSGKAPPSRVAYFEHLDLCIVRSVPTGDKNNWVQGTKSFIHVFISSITCATTSSGVIWSAESVLSAALTTTGGHFESQSCHPGHSLNRPIKDLSCFPSTMPSSFSFFVFTNSWAEITLVLSCNIFDKFVRGFGNLTEGTNEQKRKDSRRLGMV